MKTQSSMVSFRGFADLIRISLVVLLLFGCLRVQAKEKTRPGYVITLQGDTVRGTVMLPKDWVGTLKLSGFFDDVRFCDSLGEEHTYLPAQLKGYGIAGMPAFRMLLTDDPEPRLITQWSLDSSGVWHFQSFEQVPMMGAFATIKKNTFLMRQLSGRINIYYLYRVAEAMVSSSDVTEHYLLREGEDKLYRLNMVKFKLPLRYKVSEIKPLMEDWPEVSRYFGKDLSLNDVFIGVIRYNEWAAATRVQ